MWGDEDDDDISIDSDNDDSGRLYDFVVAKTNDQEENVIARPGFTVRSLCGNFLFALTQLFSHLEMGSPLLADQLPRPGIHADHKDLSPRLLYGEIVQGFMTAEFKKAETLVEEFHRRDQSPSQIRLLL